MIPSRSIRELLAGRDGLRVIGDVHGAIEPFRAAVQGGRDKNLAILSLGDIIDRGPDAPACMRLLLDLLEHGDGEIVPGNHDDKFRRFLAGAKVEIGTSGLGRTIAQLAADAEGEALGRRFADAIAARPLWRAWGKMAFVHGAFDPVMPAVNPTPTPADRGVATKLVSKALYGETDGTKTKSGHPHRTYRWVDRVPAGMTVFVGHDVVSTTEIVRRQGALGGIVVHLDTGVDRGGMLSFVDLSRDELGG